MIEYKWFLNGEKDSSFENIRKEVFVDEQRYPPELEFDHYDEICSHLTVFADGEAVATGRVVELENKIAKLGRIAVLKKARGSGLGEKTVLELLRFAEEQGYKKVLLGAQTYAVGFYEKCGFKLMGTSEYYDEHIPHLDMYLDL